MALVNSQGGCSGCEARRLGLGRFAQGEEEPALDLTPIVGAGGPRQPFPFVPAVMAGVLVWLITRWLDRAMK